MPRRITQRTEKGSKSPESIDPSTEEQLQLFYDLLATIHRDGGHYQARHGILKAYNDAIDKVTSWIFSQY